MHHLFFCFCFSSFSSLPFQNHFTVRLFFTPSSIFFLCSFFFNIHVNLFFPLMLSIDILFRNVIHHCYSFPSFSRGQVIFFFPSTKSFFTFSFHLSSFFLGGIIFLLPLICFLYCEREKKICMFYILVKVISQLLSHALFFFYIYLDCFFCDYIFVNHLCPVFAFLFDFISLAPLHSNIFFLLGMSFTWYFPSYHSRFVFASG